MSTLRTLHDAFTELERRADSLPVRTEQFTPAPGAGTSPRRRPGWAPLLVAAAVAVIIAGAILAGVRLWPAHIQQPATTRPQGVITLWLAEDATCPTQPATHPAPKAVLTYRDGCLRMINIAGTFTSPLHAQTTNSQGRWMVNVALTEQQAKSFNDATQSAVGHQLAIVGDGQVLSAPVVEEPITVSKLIISATSADDAHAITRILNNP